MFLAVLCAHCSIELVWVGSNLHILDLLGERGLTTAQTALAQSVGAVTAMAVTVVAGLGIDRLPGASKRWVLVGACACGAGALAALRACTGVALGAAYSSLLGAMMGPLDVAHGTLYAAPSARRELPQILGVVSAVTMACVGASPLLFGIAHERTGSVRRGDDAASSRSSPWLRRCSPRRVRQHEVEALKGSLHDLNASSAADPAVRWPPAMADPLCHA